MSGISNHGMGTWMHVPRDGTHRPDQATKGRGRSLVDGLRSAAAHPAATQGSSTGRTMFRKSPMTRRVPARRVWMNEATTNQSGQPA